MSDYCFCGRSADARCNCGQTMCQGHVKHPAWYNSSIGALTRSPKALHRALAEAWNRHPQTMCYNCYDTALTAVGHDYAAAFKRHTDGHPHTIAAILVDLGFWATGYEGEGRKGVGQRTIAAAGTTPVWSHPDPMDTAAHMVASTLHAPAIECGYERYRKSFFTKSGKDIFVPLFSLNGWVIKIPGQYDVYSTTTFLVGANGAHTKINKTTPSTAAGARAIFDSESDAAQARTALMTTSVFWSSLPQSREYDAEGAAAKVLVQKILKPLTSDV